MKIEILCYDNNADNLVLASWMVEYANEHKCDARGRDYDQKQLKCRQRIARSAIFANVEIICLPAGY